MAYKDKAKAIENQNKWQRENCDRISLIVPKGQKDEIKTHAMKTGDGSINVFIKRAIAETMARDKGEQA